MIYGFFGMLLWYAADDAIANLFGWPELGVQPWYVPFVLLTLLVYVFKGHPVSWRADK